MNEILTILTGDCFEMMKTFPDDSINCCVTSVPYWNLRDYKVAGQIGLERTPEEWTDKLVAVFREVRRVLRNDGTCWINCGDSYNAGGRGGNPTADTSTLDGSLDSQEASMVKRSIKRLTTLKPKDLLGLPWRLAFALQKDGWYLRSEIIWQKPSCMPESVSDRPTKSHETIFLLSKREQYFYDADAIKEPSSPDSHARYARGRSDDHKYADGGPGDQTIAKSFEHMRKPNGWHNSEHYEGQWLGRLAKEGVNSRMHQDRDPKHSAARKQRKLGVNPKASPAGSGIKQNESFSARERSG